MKLSELFTDDDAVSPVIGVILMVAITVILAAVIATFVLGLGQQVSQSAPRASFTFDFTEDTDTNGLDDLNITHDGGDTIKANRLKVTSDTQFQSAIDGGDGLDVDASTSAKFSDFGDQAGAESDINAGFELKIESDSSSSGENLRSATVRVIWESQEGDSTATLAKFEGPEA